MESADVSMPLFDAQQWKVRTSACHCLTHNNGNVNHSTHKCKLLSTQSLFLRALYVDKERHEPLCGVSLNVPKSLYTYSLFLDIKSFHSQVVSQPLIAGRFTATFKNPSVISQPLFRFHRSFHSHKNSHINGIYIYIYKRIYIYI